MLFLMMDFFECISYYAQRGAEAHSSRAEPALLLLTTERAGGATVRLSDRCVLSSIAALTVPCCTGPLRGEHIQSVAQMCEASRGLHGLIAEFSFAASQRRPKRHSMQNPIASLGSSLRCFLLPQCCA